MSINFIRAWQLDIDGLISIKSSAVDLKIRFGVKMNTPNQECAAEIRLYNLSTETAEKLMNIEKKILTLQAGYADNIGVIYQGDIVKTQKGRESPVDTFVDIFCKGGEQAKNRGVIKKTFAAGSTQEDHFKEVLKVFKPFGIAPGVIKGLSKTPYPRAVTLFGMAQDVLRNIAHTNRSSWYITYQKLHHIPDQDKAEGDEFILNSNTGMVGMPVETNMGSIIVTALINPSIHVRDTPICKVHIDEKDIQLAPWLLNTDQSAINLNRRHFSITADGVYTVQGIEYNGDTRGEMWFMTMICFGLGQAPGTQELIPTQTGPG